MGYKVRATPHGFPRVARSECMRATARRCFRSQAGALLGLATLCLTAYAILATCVEAGVAALSSPVGDGSDNRELVAELVSIGARLVDVERMLDRALFTACASYCYARSAAFGGGKSDEAIGVEISRAYDRQRRLAEEHGS